MDTVSPQGGSFPIYPHTHITPANLHLGGFMGQQHLQPLQVEIKLLFLILIFLDHYFRKKIVTFDAITGPVGIFVSILEN